MASYTIELSRLTIVDVQVRVVKIYVAAMEALRKSYLYIDF
jgi:hypothetical protein